MQHSQALAKLTAPRLGKVYLRTRLFSALDAARDKPVIWISAPAGSGKTTLVASYLQHKKIKLLWYQIDEGDADLASFFYYLGLLGKQAAPRKKKDLPLLTPEYLLGLPVFTRNFFRELYSRIKSPGVLVFDNFQDAGMDVTLHQFLPQALAEIPDAVNVMVISRADPPTSMARLRTSDQLAVLDWSDLRLTDDESVAIGQLHSRNKSISDTTYQAINAQVGGWIAGLVLSLKHGGEAVLPETMTDQKAIFDYFAGEIFARLDERSRTVLQQTAFLTKISVAAARQLSHDQSADQILTELADHNSFTFRHAGPVVIYEYHPLFREFLQSRAERLLGRDEFDGLLRQSAQQLETEGNIDQAIDLLQQADDWQAAGRLIMQNAQTLVEQGRGLTVADWIKPIPEEKLDKQPWLLFWQGVALLPYSPPDSRHSLEKAYVLFKATEDTAGRLLAWSFVVETFFLEYADYHPLDHWIVEMDEWLAANAKYPSPEIQARVAGGMFTALMWRKPYEDELREVWEPRLSELVLRGEDPVFRLQYGGLLFLYYSHWIGDCSKGKVVLDSLSSLKERSDLPPLVELTWHFHAGIQYFVTGQIEQARQTMMQGLWVTDEHGLRIYESFLSSMLYYASLLVREQEDVKRYRERMHAALRPGSHIEVAQYHMALAYEAIIANKVTEAREHVNRSMEEANESGALFFISYTEAADALVTAHEGRVEEALMRFQEARASTQRNFFVSLEIANCFFEAELFLVKREHERCLAPLREALGLARRTGINNPLWWRDPVMSRLLAIALAHDVETDYVRFLIRQRHLIPPDDLPVPDAWPFPVKVYTLGRFSLVINGEPVVFKGKAPKKALELLKALIAFGGRDISVEQLTDALWPDAEGDAAYQSFTMALQRLRNILDHKDALVLREGKLTLVAHYVWVDRWAFERGPGEADPAALGQALALYRGDFLNSEPNAPWALSAREHLRQRFLRGLAEHGLQLEQQDQPDQAIALYERGLEVDPLAESFYQGLMRCHQSLGRPCEAVKAYERCKDVLTHHLGVGPSDQTREIYRAIQVKS